MFNLIDDLGQHQQESAVFHKLYCRYIEENSAFIGFTRRYSLFVFKISMSASQSNLLTVIYSKLQPRN